MNIKIFWQENCPNCPKAKELGEILESNENRVQYYNIDTVDGLAEASYFDVLSTPSVIISDRDDREIKSWRGTVPCLEEVKKEIR